MKLFSTAIFTMLFVILICGCNSIDTDTSAKIWRKGAIHTHTLWSDGRSLPEVAVYTYKKLGYDFMCISDHNVFPDQDLWLPILSSTGPWPCSLSKEDFKFAEKVMPGLLIRKSISFRTYVKLRTFKELAEIFNEDDKFILIPGEEITVSHLEFSDGGKHEYHMNTFNVPTTLPPLRGKTPQETLEKNYEQYRKNIPGDEDESFFMVNHPYWKAWDVDPEALINNHDIKHFEICNNGSSIPLDHIYSVDQFWDFILAHRIDRNAPPIYATATDDSHFYLNAVGKNSGNDTAWIMVNCPQKMTPAALAKAINRGDFYATTGVELADMDANSDTGILYVKVTPEQDVSYQIKFIVTKKDFDRDIVRQKYPAQKSDYNRELPIIPDSIGVTVSVVQGTQAAYKLEDDDLYVRAVIVSDKKAPIKARMYPEYEQAWTQPLINRKLKK